MCLSECGILSSAPASGRRHTLIRPSSPGATQISQYHGYSWSLPVKPGRPCTADQDREMVPYSVRHRDNRVSPQTSPEPHCVMLRNAGIVHRDICLRTVLADSAECTGPFRPFRATSSSAFRFGKTRPSDENPGQYVLGVHALCPRIFHGSRSTPRHGGKSNLPHDCSWSTRGQFALLGGPMVSSHNKSYCGLTDMAGSKVLSR